MKSATKRLALGLHPPRPASVRDVLKKHDSIPPELANALYAKSMEMEAEGLGGISIAKELSVIYGLNVCPGTINHWIYGDHKPRLRNIFQEKPSPALSYIIGANLGDGCSLIKSGCVKLEVTDMDFAQAFNACMATLFSRQVPNSILVRRFETDRLPLFIVKYNSKQLAKLLAQPLKTLLRIALAYPREFLRGFFDAEGHVDVGAGATFHISSGVENSNRKLLLKVKQTLLTRFHITSRMDTKRKSGTLKTIRGKSFRMRKTSFSLLITRIRDLKKFEERIGFSISRKDQKLADALMISANYALKERVIRWKEMYVKLRGEWARPELPPSAQSKVLRKGQMALPVGRSSSPQKRGSGTL